MMNQKLQQLLDSIQQSAHLSDDEKIALASSVKEVDKEMEITSFKLDRTEKVKKTTAILLEETIEELEQKRKAVEAQNKELEIESSLERVRTVAMGMNKRDDMLDICRIISEQLELLQVKDTRNVQTAIMDEGKHIYLNYEYYRKTDKTFITEVDYTLHPVQEAFARQMLRGKGSFYSTRLEGEKLDEFIKHQKAGPEFVDPFLFEAASLTWYWASLGPIAFGVSTYSPLDEESQAIVKRFQNVFELSYRRYLDIEKAEAQSKEAQIETSLERVRAQAMAMRTPEDLTGICEVLYKELHSLDFAEMRNAMINIHDDPKESFVNYDYSDEIGKSINHLTYDIHPLIAKQIKQVKSAEGFSVTSFTGQDLKDSIAFRKKVGEKDDPRMEKADALYYYFYSIGMGSIGISTFSAITEEKLDTLKRFRNVFNLSYQRYIDIAHAEAQAKEAQVEAALEKVRSRSLAMQKSEELKDVIQVVYEQFVHLKVNTEHTGFVIDYKDRDDRLIWVASKHGVPAQLTIPYFDCEYYNRFNEAKEKGRDFFATNLSFEDKNRFYRELFKYVPDLPEDAKEFYFSCKGLAVSTVLLENVALYIENFEGIPYSDEDNAILMRFGKVFQQTYTRFLDLQKAEAQAREAKIEAALERTRTQSMIMQHSNELGDSLRVFHEQVLLLNIPSAFSFLWLPDEKNDRHAFWAAWKEQENGSAVFKTKAINYPLDRNEPATAQCLVDWKSNEAVYSYLVPPAAVENYFAVWQELIDGVDHLKPSYFSGGLHYVEAFMKYGCFGVMVVNDLSDDEKKILGRFAIEFERTYTRFLDLQKAEAQAKEALIETAMERVRSRSMGMQKSDELAETAYVLFQQLELLGEDPDQLGIGILNEKEAVLELWTTINGKIREKAVTVSLDEPIVMQKYYAGWKEEKKTLVIDISGEELEQYNNYRKSLNTVNIETGKTKDRRVISIAYFSKGAISLATAAPRPAETLQLLERFANVFDLTYTRFLDLQRAEAQAREAQIELGLERVRARAMAMQRSDELKELIGTVFTELTKLDLVLTRCLIMIFDQVSKDSTWWMANSEAPNDPTGLVVQHHELPPYQAYLKGWQDRNLRSQYILEGEDKKQWDDFLFAETGLSRLPDFVIAGMKAPGKVYLNASFNSFGNLTLATLEPLSEEHFDILLRFAKVFDLTYTRFNDLQKAEAQTREAHIDAALERVRAQTMAMHNSEDVSSAIETLFKQIELLGIEIRRCGIAIVNENKTMEVWSVTMGIDGKAVKATGDFDMSIHPLWMLFYEAWKKRSPFLHYYLTGREKNDYLQILNNTAGYLAQPLVEMPDMHFQSYHFNEGAIWTFSINIHTEENKQLMNRFTNVFSQTFRRYQDLQKAEAQAREAQIEASLERVRSKAMAMQKSEDLANAVGIVFEELDKLNLGMLRCGIGILNKEKRCAQVWTTTVSENNTVVLSSTVGSEAWNSRDLKSRPH